MSTHMKKHVIDVDKGQHPIGPPECPIRSIGGHGAFRPALALRVMGCSGVSVGLHDGTEECALQDWSSHYE